MADLFGDDQLPPIRRARSLVARLAATLAAIDGSPFETEPVRSIDLALDGVAGDRHAGFTRPAGPREPWYPRGAEIRSGRQISIVSVEELDAVSAAMETGPIAAGWIGANLLIEGLPRLSFLPPGTRLFFEGGAAIVVEAQNAPCRHAGRAIARHTGRPGDEVSFPKMARRLRGLVASVERPGAVVAGTELKARLPEQWIY